METFPGPENASNTAPAATVPVNASPVATLPPAPPMVPSLAPVAAPRRGGIGFAIVIVVTMLVAVVVASSLSPALTQARIIAYPQPSIAIQVQGGSPTRVGDMLQFAAQVNTGNDLTFSWDFGDATGGEGKAVQHAYTQYGDFTVKLVASDPIGQHATTTAQVTVLPEPPQACFTATPDSNNPFQIDFDASCSTGAQLQYVWDFGDGNSDNNGSDQQTQNTYSRLGTFHVTLRVEDAASQSNSVTQVVHVTLPKPTASFIVSNDFGDCFSFDASASTGYQLTYNWDYGDGNTSTGNSYSDSSYCYSYTGTYTVKLTIVDSGNQSASATQTVNAP